MKRDDRLTPEGREAIAKAQRKRWKKFRAEKKKAAKSPR